MQIRDWGISFVAVLGVVAVMGTMGCSQQPAADSATVLEVDSSTFSEVGYNPMTEELTVVFRENGETYIYEGVPTTEYDALIGADSLGAYYHDNIRGTYEYRQLQE